MKLVKKSILAPLALEKEQEPPTCCFSFEEPIALTREKKEIGGRAISRGKRGYSSICLARRRGKYA